MRSDRNVAVNDLITQPVSEMVPGWMQQCYVTAADSSILLQPSSMPGASLWLVTSHLTINTLQK